MGFLEKFGLTEEAVPKKHMVIPTEEEKAVTVVVPAESAYDLAAFYAANGFTDEGVFQLEAYMSTMPPTLTDEQKVKTVIGIITASKLDLPTFLDDAVKRVAALQTYIDSQSIIITDRIQLDTKNIEALQAEVARYQKDIEEAGELIVSFKKAFTTEIDRVNAIIKPFNDNTKS